MIKILVEAAGSYTSGYLIESIQQAGYHCVASDISPHSAGAKLADSFIEFPKVSAFDLWSTVETLLIEHKVNVVIPTFDEMLLGWADRKTYFAKLGITVITSDSDTHQIFGDKWSTYQAFKASSIPTPKTSLATAYQLLKPRIGRGAQGITRLKPNEVDHTPLVNGMISQQIAEGQEYTVDCLFDRAGVLHYCIPRKRIAVKEGKSTGGKVDLREDIIFWIKELSKRFLFQGPINIQCFANANELKFIEINARFGGGSALGMAASENWIPLLIEHFALDRELVADEPIKNSMTMYRQYREVFCEN